MKKILIAAALTSALLGACSHRMMHDDNRPMPMAQADSDMQRVLDAQASLKPKPIETLSAAEARRQPTPTDGIKKVMRSMGKNPNDPMGVATRNMSYATGGTMQPIRIYRPMNAKGNLPVVVYYHGGGFVIADLDVYDATPRAMAKMANAVVVSVEYRKGPEHRFPAAFDDAFNAYQWSLKNAKRFGGDSRHVAVMGESAGGALALATAVKARDTGIQQTAYEALIYPVGGVDMNTPSYLENAKAKPLNKPMMAWFMKNFLRSEVDKQDPRVDVIGKADLHGLAPATIITAQIDPLRSDGERLAAKLQQSGVAVKLRNYEGVTHEFFGMGAVVSDAKAAEGVVASDLKAALAK